MHSKTKHNYTDNKTMKPWFNDECNKAIRRTMLLPPGCRLVTIPHFGKLTPSHFM